LVVHYVDDHGYLPPQEFVDAVLRQAARLDRAWSDAKDSILVGTSVSGVVKQSYVSGVHVVLDGFPAVRAIVEADLYWPEGITVEPEAFPKTGEKIVAVVDGHDDEGRRVTLRVDPELSATLLLRAR
jgi:hypothetical protein